jgi:hypothetical protein
MLHLFTFIALMYGNAKALPHVSRVAAEFLLAHVPQVHLPEEPLDDLVARATLGNALEHREVIEEVLCPCLWIAAELLRQVAERLAGSSFRAARVFSVR